MVSHSCSTCCEPAMTIPEWSKKCKKCYSGKLIQINLSYCGALLQCKWPMESVFFRISSICTKIQKVQNAAMLYPSYSINLDFLLEKYVTPIRAQHHPSIPQNVLKIDIMKTGQKSKKKPKCETTNC